MAEVFWKPQYHWHILSFFVQGWTWHEWGGQVHDYNQLLRVSLLLRFTINFYLPWICTRDQPILESRDQTGHIHFWLRSPKKVLISFYFLWICINMQKNPFIQSIHSSDAANFKAPSHDWTRPFLTMQTLKTSMQKIS